jgi:hypothetical protein
MKIAMLIFFVALLVVSGSSAVNGPAGSPKQLWSSNQLMGDVDIGKAVSSSPFNNGRVSILFPDNERLMFYRQVHEVGSLVTREDRSKSPNQLEIKILDAKSGDVVSQKRLPTGPYGSRIYVTLGGFVVQSGTTVWFYSSAFEQLGQRSLAENDPVSRLFLSVSTSGKTVVLNHATRTNSSIEIIDGQTFQSKQKWEQGRLYQPYSVSDHALAVPDFQSGDILVQQFGAQAYKRISTACLQGVTFVNDTQLFNTCTAQLYSLDGASLMRDSPKGTPGRETRVGADGKHLAMVVSTERGGGWLDTTRRLVAMSIFVYDLQSGNRLTTLEVKPLPRLVFDFALSPNGSKIVVLSDHNVSLYQLG